MRTEQGFLRLTTAVFSTRNLARSSARRIFLSSSESSAKSFFSYFWIVVHPLGDASANLMILFLCFFLTLSTSHSYSSLKSLFKELNVSSKYDFKSVTTFSSQLILFFHLISANVKPRVTPTAQKAVYIWTKTRENTSCNASCKINYRIYNEALSNPIANVKGIRNSNNFD